MNAARPDSELEQRLEALERRLASTVAAISQNESRVRALEGLNRRRQPGLPSAEPSSPVRSELRRVRTATRAHETPVPVGVMVAPAPPPRARRVKTPDPAALSDFLGGRALAWIGAIATVLGICLLLALAISHGWIGREARVGLAAAGSAALMAAGVWLHARRGRTEAAVAMVGAATTGSFATLIVAGQVYQLIPPMAAVVGSMLVGAVATALAIRWAGRAIAVLGLIGALLSPVLAGAAGDGTTIAMLAVAAGCSVAVVLWRRWPWLAFAAVLVCAPQWLAWMAHGHTRLLNVAVLAGFGSIGLLGAVFAQLRSPKDLGLLRSAAGLALLNATIVGVAGRVVLGSTGAAAWLVALALVHAGLGLWRRPRIAIHDTLRRLLIAIGVVAADAALTLSIHGVVLSAAWGAAAIGFAWLMRRSRLGAADEPWAGVGLGAHIGLLLTHALIGLPPSELAAGPQLAPMASVAILAATCLGCARATGSERGRWRIAVDGLGLLAVGYLTAATLEGPALVGAWALESIALAEIGRRMSDPLARYGGLAFLAVAAVHCLIFEAPPTALVGGVEQLDLAGIALGALGLGALLAGLAAERDSPDAKALLAASGIAAIYLASVAIISGFQPAAGDQSELVLDLSVRQQGQVLLSALWGIVGVAGLIAGLRQNVAALRTSALVLLLAAVAKVFLYDLSILTSIYRVISFLVLGGLLLAGAFAYQRLRPPPQPDLRSVHRSQR